MTYLLDTNILSETRKQVRDPGVTEWIDATPTDQQRLSVLTVGEIGRGITRLRHRRDHQQAEMFATWLDEVVLAFGDRVVPVTVAVARTWGKQVARTTRIVDALIGATAQTHGWTLVTRHTKDFEHTGVRLLNPFTA